MGRCDGGKAVGKEVGKDAGFPEQGAISAVDSGVRVGSGQWGEVGTALCTQDGPYLCCEQIRHQLITLLLRIF